MSFRQRYFPLHSVCKHRLFCALWLLKAMLVEGIQGVIKVQRFCNIPEF